MEMTTSSAAVHATLPSFSQQKSFIIDNVAVLNKETKVAILSIVMMEIGAVSTSEAGDAHPVVFESGPRDLDIDLDTVGSVNPEVIAHIYNIVYARRKALSQPARQ